MGCFEEICRVVSILQILLHSAGLLLQRCEAINSFRPRLFDNLFSLKPFSLFACFFLLVCACCTSTRLKLSGTILALFGLSFLLVALLVPRVIHQKLDDGITQFLAITPDAMKDQTEGFRTWSNWADEDALPIYQEIYMYNITNPEEILNSSSTKPIVTQHGPYVYREYKVKFDFQYGVDYENNKQVQFREWVYWVYQPDMTDSRLDPNVDKYTTFNLPFQAVTNAYAALGLLPLVWSSFDNACNHPSDMDKLFTRERTVTELLFGYKDCITIAGNIPADGITPAQTFPGILGTNLPPSNVTNQYVIGNLTKPDTILTGEDDAADLRQYVQWKGEQYLTVWGAPSANRVAGTDGSQFARDVKEGQTVNAWVSDLVRHAPLVNLDNEHVRDLHGLDLLRFTMDSKVLKNETLVPENAAYYNVKHNGMLDLSHAKSGLPIFMSKPHFLDADESLQNDIIGLKPDRDAHDTFLDVEPITGATMRARKRLQVNIHTAPFTVSSSVPTWYAHVGDHFIPMAWIAESGDISESKAKDFKSSVYGARDAMKYVELIPTIIGSIFIGAAIVIFFIAAKRQAREVITSGEINQRY